MLDFQPLRLEDLPRLRNFFEYSGSRLCDTTAGATLIWRDLYRTRFAVYDSSLYFMVDYPGLGHTFTLPLGGGRTEQYRQIAQYCRRREMPINFYPVPRDELERLQDYFPNSAAVAERDSFDYLYRAEDLMYFRGKKLSGPRNHLNKFLKTYGNWTFRKIVPEDLSALHSFLDRYAGEREKESPSFQEDLRKTHEVLDHYETYDFLGGILLSDGEIVGFSLSEAVGDTLFTHIEKADRNFEGGYQMVVSQTAQTFARGDVAFINREDDTGDPGLRKSKLSYRPIALLEKYTVTVE